MLIFKVKSSWGEVKRQWMNLLNPCRRSSNCFSLLWMDISTPQIIKSSQHFYNHQILNFLNPHKRLLVTITSPTRWLNAEKCQQISAGIHVYICPYVSINEWKRTLEFTAAVHMLVIKDLSLCGPLKVHSTSLLNQTVFPFGSIAIPDHLSVPSPWVSQKHFNALNTRVHRLKVTGCSKDQQSKTRSNATRTACCTAFSLTSF